MTSGLNFRQCSSPFLNDGRVQRLPILTHTAGEDEHLFTEPPTDQKPEQQGARPVGRSAHAEPRLRDARPALASLHRA